MIKKIKFIGKLPIRIILLLIVGFGVLFIFWKNFGNAMLFASTQYYRYINPSGGAIRLEKSYKNNFDGAETSRNNGNAIGEEIQQNPGDINTLFGYQEKIRGFMSVREAHFSEMLRIDDEALKLNLPNQYKEFYAKRGKADENELAAFKIHRDGIQKAMNGTLSYFKFSKLFNDAMDFITVLSAPKGFTPENIDRFDQLVFSLQKQYIEVQTLLDQGVFTAELVGDMKNQSDIMRLYSDLNTAYAEGDKQKIDKITKQLNEKIKLIHPSRLELVIEWRQKLFEPVNIAQNEKHKKSLNLYNEAYIYAENQNLKNILSIWNNNPPGSNFESPSI